MITHFFYSYIILSQVCPGLQLIHMRSGQTNMVTHDSLEGAPANDDKQCRQGSMSSCLCFGWLKDWRWGAHTTVNLLAADHNTRSALRWVCFTNINLMVNRHYWPEDQDCWFGSWGTTFCCWDCDQLATLAVSGWGFWLVSSVTDVLPFSVTEDRVFPLSFSSSFLLESVFVSQPCDSETVENICMIPVNSLMSEDQFSNEYKSNDRLFSQQICGQRHQVMGTINTCNEVVAEDFVKMPHFELPSVPLS